MSLPELGMYATAMQTHHLRAFLVLAEELNFHRAAERLLISQPGLSEQIRALERQLGSTLFTRSRSGTALTPAGKRLLPLASNVMSAVGNLEEAATTASRRNCQPTPRHRIRVGILGDGIGASTWLVLNHFHLSRPDVAIIIYPMGFVESFHAVERNLADVVFVIGPGSDSTDQQVQTIGWEPVGVLQSKHSTWKHIQSIDLNFVASRLTYDPPSSMDITFRQFWALTKEREKIRSPLSRLRTPPDGRSLPALINQAGVDGAITLWPTRLPIPATSNCIVRPLPETLNAPRQILTQRGVDHADELARIAEQISIKEPSTGFGTNGP